jgi:hypothetical protein
MNAENFSKYLQNPSLLHQLSYEELKTMALQYPYCQPLRLLLLKKSLLDNKSNWREALAQVASRSVDRKLLFDRVKALGGEGETVDNFLMAEEYLELKSLEDLQEEAIPLMGQEGAAPEEEEAVQFEFGPAESAPYLQELPDLSVDMDETPPFASADTPPLPPKLEDWETEQLDHITNTLSEDNSPPTAPAPTYAPFGKRENRPASPEEAASSDFEHRILPGAILVAIAISQTMGKPTQKSSDRMPAHAPLHQGIPRPRPKTSFTSWLSQFQPPDIKSQLSSIMESKKREELKKKKKEKKKAAQRDVNQIAEESVTPHPDVVSETLAKLFARQGQHAQAIEIYERLMLVFPKKSAYFAEQIEQLKKKD